MTPSWCVVGRNVVCVREVRWYVGVLLNHMHLAQPRLRHVYTIRAVQRDRASRVGLLLQEIVNPEHQWRDGVGEPMWRVGQFRPLPVTSLEQFVPLLAPIDPELVPCE